MVGVLAPMGLSGFVSGFTRKIAWTGAIFAVAGLSGVLGVLAVIYGLVYFGDDSNLKKSTILARINEETNIYMLDEETQIGSIFANAHRRYVPIDEVPAHMINALIAAEDKNFYTHHGVDPGAMFAAGLGYFKGGRMRGASTLTQQTVRNILGWWELSAARKFKEWIAAMQLERLYSKRQILEFYLNQFYVSGNGNGIGIAAKYYFNKDVKDLDLVESAFIAGSVKGPSQYDPFIKYTKERREKAIKNAYIRKNYVVKRMYEQGWISEAQFKESWEAPVKFQRGRFRSEEVSLVHLIQDQLNQKEVLKALNIDDPRELSAAGLKIFTTLDKDMQTAAQLSVRRNLSRLETILKGYHAEPEDMFTKLRSLTVNDFYFGQVTGFGGTEKEPTVKLSFGLPQGEIPYESLMRYAKVVDLPWFKGWQKSLKDLIAQIKVGDVLYTEVMAYDVEKHEAVVELMKRPRVNGGLIAIDKGEVRAVVSGFDTHGFNRSIAAKRQPGSVFKPVVFFAALQLGWSILDRLDNERQIFPFQGRFYYPRGDHDSPYKECSMLWAGTTSENMASVSLTSRLVEKLNFDQYKQLMGTMDLLPHPGEAPRDFHFRVARYTGVSLDDEGIKEFQLTNAVNDVLLDVQYTATVEMQQRLKKMWWGRGYQSEMQSIFLTNDDLSVGQRAAKLKLASNNFGRYAELDKQLSVDWKTITDAVTAKGAEAAFSDAAVQQVVARFRVLPGLSKPALGYVTTLPGERPERAYKNAGELDKLLEPSGRPLNQLDMTAIWGGNAVFGSADITLTDVQIDGWLPHGNFAQLSQYVEQHYAEVTGRQEEYDLHRYFQHHDFRVALGLKYLVNLAHAMGVTSSLEPVLSFPLGTNVVTLAEVAKIYQTFVSGRIYRFYEDGPPNQLNFIRRIEDRFGNKLYEPKRREAQLVQPEFAMQIREVLQRVVTHGTGRRARAELYLTLNPEEKAFGPKGKPPVEKRIRIPAFGKTGTTNDYNNANFAGFMPYPAGQKGEPLDPEASYVLASYAGYDLNKKMEAGAIKVSGAIGALPAWIGLAKEIIEKKKFVDKLDPLDLGVVQSGEWPMVKDTRTAAMKVDMPRGVILGGGGGDQEAVATSNIAKEGESAFDEFRANVVEASVRMPTEGGAPVRMFAPFKLDPKLMEESNKVPVPPPQPLAGEPAGAQTGAAQAAPVSVSKVDLPAAKDTGGHKAVLDGAGGKAPVKEEDLEKSYDDQAPAAVSPTTPAAKAADEAMGIMKDVDADGAQAPAAKDQPAEKNDQGFMEEELW